MTNSALVRALLRRETEKADCSRRRVGAVVSFNGVIMGKGHNSLPKGSCTAGDCQRGRMSYEEQPKDVGYEASGCFSIHAEENAIAEAGRWCVGATIYVTDKPCPRCREHIKAAGIAKVRVVRLHESRSDSN